MRRAFPTPSSVTITSELSAVEMESSRRTIFMKLRSLVIEKVTVTDIVILEKLTIFKSQLGAFTLICPYLSMFRMPKNSFRIKTNPSK